jgi:cystine transport system permease protein
MRHLSRTALLLVVLISAALLGGCGSKSDGGRPLSSGVLRVGTEGTYAPFSYHDPATGQLTGYDVDVARAVGDKLGVKVEFVETPWDSIFAALEANRFDVVGNEVTITPERQAKYDLSEPYSVGEGVTVTRADDSSITSLADLRGKTSAQSMTSNWTQIARGAGANVEAVEVFAQAIKLLNQGRVDATINDSIAVYAYLAETGDTSVKIAAQIGQKSEQGFAARKNSGLLPELNKAIDELRADGTLVNISQKYLKANATGAEPGAAPRSTVQLIADNLWPLAKAAITKTIPLTVISFAIGLVIALVVALARLSPNAVIHGIARLYISIIRGTPLLVQLFIVFFALPELHIKIDPFPRGGDRVQPERGRLRRGDHPLRDPEHPERTVGGRRDDRPELSRNPAQDHPAASHPGGRSAAVEHGDLTGQRHLTGIDHFGDRAAADRPDRGGTDLRILRALRHCRGVLLGDLPGAFLHSGARRAPAGKVRGPMTDNTGGAVEYRVVADNVHKAFGANNVLNGVCFTVARGTATTIIGPSGSGKTTLLRALAGLDVPEAGIIRVGEVEVDFDNPVAKDVLRRYRAQSGFVFQSHNLFPHKTVLQNVTEGPLIAQRRPAEEVRAEAVQLLHQVGLADKRDQYPYQLSGGQQQRVGIARALALKPRVVLFDEPTSALDPELVGEVLSVIRDLAIEGWTLVIVTHEIQFARQVSDQVLFTDQGIIVEQGPAAEVIGNPKEPRTRQFLERVLNPL